MNVQYAIKDGVIYVLEVNPRASRTVPFVAKVIGEPIAKIAARVMAGESLASFALVAKALPHIAVKEAVFPFARFPGVDVLLGPEMRSTGEVIGLDSSFGVAFAKSQLGSGTQVPRTGTVFVSVRDSDKARILPAVKSFVGARLQDPGDRRHAAFPRGSRRRFRKDQQGVGRTSSHRGFDQERRHPDRLQHNRGGGCALRLALAAARRPLA